MIARIVRGEKERQQSIGRRNEAKSKTEIERATARVTNDDSLVY